MFLTYLCSLFESTKLSMYDRPVSLTVTLLALWVSYLNEFKMCFHSIFIASKRVDAIYNTDVFFCRNHFSIKRCTSRFWWNTCVFTYCPHGLNLFSYNKSPPQTAVRTLCDRLLEEKNNMFNYFYLASNYDHIMIEALHIIGVQTLLRMILSDNTIYCISTELLQLFH